MPLKYIIFLAFLCSLGLVTSQNLTNPGAPYITNYDPSNHHKIKFIWTIEQDSKGVMFFGDYNGMVEFDGNEWRFHQTPNKSFVSSIAKGRDGIIYVGTTNDFGYFKPDNIGSLKFYSLHQLLPANFPYYGNVYKTLATENGIYFFTQKKIFRYFEEKIHIIPANLRYRSAFLIRNTIYLFDIQKGLCYIRENDVIPLPNCDKIEHLKDRSVLLSSLNEKELMISSSKELQFYLYDLDQQSLSVQDFPEQTKSFLKLNNLRNIFKVDSTKYAACTYGGGIAILNQDGKIVQIINENKGLASNSVYFVFVDKGKRLWAATKKGISRIDINYPAYYLKKQEIKTYITHSTFHNGMLYMASDASSFFLPVYKPNLQNDNHNVKKIDNLGSVKKQIKLNDRLFVCSSNGFFEIINGKAKKLLKRPTKYCVDYSTKYPNKIFIGENEVLGIYTFNDSKKDKYIELKDKFEIKDSINQIRSMAFDKEGNLWLGTLNDGIYLIQFGDNIEKYKITRFSALNGLPNEIQNSFVKKFNDKINIFTTKGIYKPVKISKTKSNLQFKFIHDSYWGEIFTKDSTAVAGVEQIENNKFFLYGSKTGILTAKNDSSSFNYKPFLKLKEVFSASITKNRYINIGGYDFFCIYDSFDSQTYNHSYNINIRRVRTTSNDSILFDGTYFSVENNKVVPTQPDNAIPTIDNSFNSLRFDFSSSFFEAVDETKYRYKIEGFDKSWSPWSNKSSALYTNIPYGKYEFKVMAKNVYNTESNIESYRFIIKPAWYQTIIAYTIYSLSFLALLILIIKTYNKRLTRQNSKLERLVKIRTSELSNAVDILEDQKLELKKKQKEILNKNATLTKQGEELQNTLNQLKDAQSTLVQQEKMASLGILTAGVAHEINNPLNYILGGYTGLELYFQEKQEQNEDVEVLMDSIKTGVERAADIVSSLNQFSRNKDTFNENCNIHSILDNSILMIKHLLKNKIELIKIYDAELFCVLGNVGKIHQIFINILTNACQAIEENGTITVKTSNLDNDLQVQILDNGEGIDTNNLSKITDPFFTTKEPGKGSGLGLSITYKIIQEHKGKLEFNSTLGVGTTIIITLPINKSRQ